MLINYNELYLYMIVEKIIIKNNHKKSLKNWPSYGMTPLNVISSAEITIIYINLSIKTELFY